jgi:hypothetical protein
MNQFFIKRIDGYLNEDIQAFYHTAYVKKNHLDTYYLNDLKNQFNNFNKSKLDNASQCLKSVLSADLPQIFQKLSIKPLTVCVVPRARREDSYGPDQLLFKSTVRSVVTLLNNGFCDGTDYIIRHRDTETTHLRSACKKYHRCKRYNEGTIKVHPGFTIETCTISDDVKGRDILLIDDIYTKEANYR